ncbi:MAG: hypothetical protein IBJ18_11980 [Phycisphaerales bacterium]|nr:hypothetical protein [Phycisphaerales bacterium]
MPPETAEHGSGEPRHLKTAEKLMEQMHRSTGSSARRRRTAGFTLVEIVLVTVIALLLAALIIVAIGGAIRSARRSSDSSFMRSMSLGIEQFRTDFGILPPLVRNPPSNPLINDTRYGVTRPWLQTQDNAGQELQGNAELDFYGQREAINDQSRDEAVWGTAGNIRPRHSVLSMTYYLIGVLGRDIDGVDGPGLGKPRADGSFDRSGKTYSPLFDFSNNSERMKSLDDPTDARLFTLLDRYGQPIRYYRWEHRYNTASESTPGATLGSVQSYRVPKFIGSPKDNPALRRAEGYALVSTGPDTQIDEGGEPTAAGNIDNVVEVAP